MENHAAGAPTKSSQQVQFAVVDNRANEPLRVWNYVWHSEKNFKFSVSGMLKQKSAVRVGCVPWLVFVGLIYRRMAHEPNATVPQAE